MKMTKCKSINKIFDFFLNRYYPFIKIIFLK